ncbi:MAG: hypothetical protein HXX14_19500 [Bacteroidetes bacterium]|nr:hypothetical protein [Bacteroidota bacterium]
MCKSNKLLKTIAFFVALNIFGVYVGALFNFHMHHIFHKPLLPQDMVCSSNKQKYLYTVSNHHHGDDSQVPNHDGIIAPCSSLSFQPFIPPVCLSYQQQEQTPTSYLGYSQSLRAPPFI